MHVERIGFTPLKGGRHRTWESVTLSSDGPVGDRAFCWVDPATDRCLRTIENPALLQASASWDGDVLSVDLPGGTVAGQPRSSGDTRTVDYWGRPARVELVDGPWAEACSEHLGREVALATAPAGEVVYGASVTLVTNASLARLSEQVGAPVDARRFRATFQVDTEDLPAHAEEEWVGSLLRLGSAEVRVRGTVPRCAVVDLDPVSGVRDLPVMKALASRRGPGGEAAFGIDAVVTVPGVVRTGDPVGPVDR